MGQTMIGYRSKLRTTRVGAHGLALALLTAMGIAGIGLAPRTAQAQHCRMHYTEAFQLTATQSFKGLSPAKIKEAVEDLFGPRQELCGEGAYKFFLSELETQASAAFRKKGSEQEAKLTATLEIINHLPLQVRFKNAANPGAALTQLRANLAVLGKEVGMTPAIQSVLDALAKVALPKAMSRPLPKDDDAIPITVPKVPMPAWAIITLYEIRDHASRKETAEIVAKSARILSWVDRVAPSAPPPGQPVAQPVVQPIVTPAAHPASPPPTR